MKPDKMVLANAFALWMAVIWVVCSAFVWLLPGLSKTLLIWWSHERLASLVGSMTITAVGFIGGGITLVISAWASGWLFGWAWEKMSGGK